MLFGKNDSLDAETFWKDREEELGTPVLKKCLGRVIDEDNPNPIWGLFYTTEKAVYFQTFRSENWLSMLFSGGKGKSRTQDEIIEIPSTSVLRFELVPRKKGLFQIFKQPPMIDLSWKDPLTGGENTILFEMEGNPKAFVESLPR